MGMTHDMLEVADDTKVLHASSLEPTRTARQHKRLGLTALCSDAGLLAASLAGSLGACAWDKKQAGQALQGSA